MYRISSQKLEERRVVVYEKYSVCVSDLISGGALTFCLLSGYPRSSRPSLYNLTNGFRSRVLPYRN
jgi:hypothetical protein